MSLLRLSSPHFLLSFKVYVFNQKLVQNLISSSIRHALENPLNYARSYLADMLEPCVKRVIYLDSDTIIVDEIQKLWGISLTGSKAIGAPEYCHVNFRRYFSNEFWSDPEFSEVFAGKNPCYFNTRVMVMDLLKWREGDYKGRLRNGWKFRTRKGFMNWVLFHHFYWFLVVRLRLLSTDGICMGLVETIW
ncbi:Hexosyltransferase [Quillaja saponaria]|uniref:Hexosyltransferase n=1 Tax=Quillaja saponaria TaxID=32244 RepID=A0AAD7VC01_QUISA|nr:Hexosyltransferase [Quillaja saponaria]